MMFSRSFDQSPSHVEQLNASGLCISRPPLQFPCVCQLIGSFNDTAIGRDSLKGLLMTHLGEAHTGEDMSGGPAYCLLMHELFLGEYACS